MAECKILLIDDERLLVKSTCMALKLRGFEVTGVYSGQEGLDTAVEINPDIILLDIMMPGMDGWQTLAALQEQETTKQIPVIIFTAKEYANGSSLASERGAAGFVAKPFELDNLADLINKTTAKRLEG